MSFQMLLGCPWIQGNMVSMRECVNGTYLVYEDPYDKGWQTELMGGVRTVECLDRRTHPCVFCGEGENRV